MKDTSTITRRTLLTGAAAIPMITMGQRATAQERFHFASIDGGDYAMDDWRGQPVLVVNTASLCGFTPQYESLQTLHEAYGPQGLIVLAVPSNDFDQELGSEGDVRDFCDANFNLTLPMTTITHVRGRDAHPFYAWLRDTAGFQPNWNFNKVLLDGAGRMVATYGSNVDPMSARIRRDVEALLAG
jgi:glutathione peroxidase